MVLGTLWYIWLVVRRKIQPVLTSWIIFGTTMAIGFWSYWNSPTHSLVGNIGNLTGVVSAISILIAVSVVQLCKKELGVRFNRFQVKCLAAALGILISWGMLRFVIGNEVAAAISNVFTQILMIIGYIALAERLWNAEENSESLFTWSAIFLAALFSLIPAIVKSDLLGILYGARAAITSAITVYLILRILVKKRNLQGASI